MSDEAEFKLPPSIKNCQPCQEEIIVGSLLTVCKLSKDLDSNVDCQDLADQIKTGLITKKEAIELIGKESINTGAEQTVQKIINILEQND